MSLCVCLSGVCLSSLYVSLSVVCLSGRKEREEEEAEAAEEERRDAMIKVRTPQLRC